LLVLAGCGGDDSSAVANDPLAPTVEAGEAAAPTSDAAATETGGGGLAANPSTDGDTPTENSAVTGVNPLPEEAGAGSETGSTAAGEASNSSSLPSISFNVDEQTDSLAADTETNVYSAAETTADMTDADILPAYSDIQFGGYPISDSQFAPRLYLYPVAEFEASNETAAGEIEGLRQLLAERPETAAGTLPFLPLLAEGQTQLMHAQVEYLDFAGGSGVRYLTQYSNESTEGSQEEVAQPINNNQLIYTFQGLTEDGAYYIAALFPVNHPELPAADVAAPEEFADDYEGYLAGAVQQLDEAEPGSFTPSLDMLDELIQSIIVEQPTAEPTVAYPAEESDE
jgi:hypothetical protein